MGFFNKVKKAFESSKNFKYLDNLIRSGARKIVLDTDIILEDSEKIEFRDGINLDVDDLTIDGNGHVIDARTKTRIFHCSANNITLKNITLKNTFTIENGGAIYNESKELCIINSTFISNNANKKGGAICNDGILRIENVSFEKNIAGSSYDIYNNNQLFIKGELSSDNSKSITNDKYCFIESRSFMENIENYGKIFELESLENNEKDFTYLNNLIQSAKDEIKLENDIKLNIKNNEDHLFKDGIRIDRDNLVIDGCGHSIDAINVARIFFSTGKNITLKNITLINGFVDGKGGAIDNEGELTIIDSSLKNNSTKSLTPRHISPSNAGAVSNSGILMVIGSTFIKNTADIGGAISNNREAVLDISKSKFYENKAGETGGAIDNGITAEINIVESKIFKNHAGLKGGAIRNSFGKLSISKSMLCENSGHEGGAIFTQFDEITRITQSRIFKNSADLGGAIVTKSENFNVSESEIRENTALEAGAIINEGNLKIDGCDISDNESPKNIIENRDSLQVNDSIFKANQSSKIILNNGEKSNLGIFYGKFLENYVNDSVIENNGKSLSIEKTHFENNTCYDVVNQSELTLISPKMKDNAQVILNNGYIFMKNPPKELESKIEGDGKIEISGLIEYNEFDFGYLDKLIHESDTAQIILKEDITFENYERYFYEGGIELDMDNIVIDGNGHTIDAKDKTRIFS